MLKYGLLLISLIIISSTGTFAQASDESEPPYGLSPLEAYSIFVESYKNKDYNTALIYGRWLVNNNPKTLEGYPAKYDGSRTMRRMISVYSGLAESKEDPSERAAYLDSSLTLYNKTIEIFSDDEIDKFEWKLRKARFLQQNSSYLDDALSKAYEILLELFEQDPKKLTQEANGYYLQITLQNLVSKNEKQKALDIIEEAEPHANEKLSNYFNSIRNQLFDSPEERIGFLESQLEEKPNSVKLLSELFDLYGDEDMTDKANQTAQKLYELNPNFENTKRLADNALDNANYQTAINYLKEALDKIEDEQKLKEVAMDISQAYLNLENLRQSRRYARQAAKFDPNYGQAYLQLANIYGQAVTKCTQDEMTRDDRMVYWLVMDYLDKARRVDPSTSNTVSQQKKSYGAAVPSSEDKFFMNLEDGDKIKVDSSLDPCYSWINETTTVR